MASPYYVEPLGGVDIGAGLTGLANNIQRRKEFEALERERATAKEAVEAAQKRFADARMAAETAFRSGDTDAIAGVMLQYPEVSQALSQTIGFKNEATKQNMLESLRIGALDPERIPGLIKSRSEFVRAQGGDPSQTEAELSRYEADPNAYQEKVKLAWAALDTPNYLKWREATEPGFDRNKITSYAPVGLELEGGEVGLGIPTFDPGSGRAEVRPVAVPKGARIARETPEQKRMRDIEAETEKAGRTTESKAGATRRQESIDLALNAAEQIPTITRAIDLLGSVETGGGTAAIKRLSDFLGTTSEDVGELNALLGRTIVGQLRTTFGGNPTEGERAALASIESSLSQSGKVNRRLLENALKLAKSKVERGKRAARAAGDDASIEEIEAALSIDLAAPAPAQEKRRLKYNPVTGALE